VVSRHFGPSTLRTQDISALSDWCRSVRTVRHQCRKVFRILRHWCRTVSTSITHAKMQTLGLMLLGRTNVNSSLRSCALLRRLKFSAVFLCHAYINKVCIFPHIFGIFGCSRCTQRRLERNGGQQSVTYKLRSTYHNTLIN